MFILRLYYLYIVYKPCSSIEINPSTTTQTIRILKIVFIFSIKNLII